MSDIIFGEVLPDVKYTDRHSVYAVIFNEQGQLGIVKVRGKDRYFLVGGGRDSGETERECLIRECREELGYALLVGEKIGSADYYSYCTPLHCYLKVIATYYLAELGQPCGVKVEDDHDLIWLRPKEAIANMMMEHQAWAIEQALEQKLS